MVVIASMNDNVNAFQRQMSGHSNTVLVGWFLEIQIFFLLKERSFVVSVNDLGVREKKRKKKCRHLQCDASCNGTALRRMPISSLRIFKGIYFYREMNETEAETRIMWILRKKISFELI